MKVAMTSGVQALECVLYHRTVLHTFAESGVYSCQCDFLALLVCEYYMKESKAV